MLEKTLLLLSFIFVGCQMPNDIVSVKSSSIIEEDENIVVGLSFEDEFPDDSPIEVIGNPTIFDDGERVGMEFDSASDYLIIPTDESNDLTNAGTIDLWIKPYSIPEWGGIVHKGSESDWSDESYSLQYAYGNAITLTLTPVSGGFILVRGTTDMSTRLNVWTHVVVTWNTEEAHIYLNGVEDTLYTQANYAETPVDFSMYPPFKNSTGDILIGKQVPDPTDGGIYQFDGILSNVLIYDVYTTDVF